MVWTIDWEFKLYEFQYFFILNWRIFTNFKIMVTSDVQKRILTNLNNLYKVVNFYEFHNSKLRILDLWPGL